MTASTAALSAVSAITLQLLRLSVDLIQLASTSPSPRQQNSSSQQTTGDKAESSTRPPHGHHHNLPVEEGVVNESKPLLSTSPPSDEENPNPNHASVIDASHALASSNIVKFRFRLFLVGWVISLLIFVGIIIFAKGSRSSTQTFMVIYPNSLVAATIAVMLIEIACHCLDAERLFYGTFRRLLRLGAMLILWSAFLVYFMRSYQDPLQQPKWYSAGNIMLLDVTALVGIALTDSWLAQAYPTPARRQSLTEAANKPMLSTAALLTLVKPYVWPDATNETALWNRLRAIVTWVCVILSKACNLVTPLLIGQASTALAHEDYGATVRLVIVYSILSWLGSTFREGQFLFYLKVGQAAFVQLSETSFDHLHHLSLDWHLRKKLGEVLRSMDRGIAACDTLMRYLFMRLLPALVECFLVTVIFATYFQYFPLAVTVFYFVFAYIVWTILVTLWRKKFRRALVKSDNDWHDIFTDSMINFETVKHFTAEDYELNKFRTAVNRYQAGSVDVQGSLSFLNVSQKFLFQACMAASMSLAVRGIKQRIACCTETAGCEMAVSDCCRSVSSDVCPGMEVGDFVAVLSYLVNLFAPLDFLGTVYNAVVMAMVDLANLSELLAENPDVVDSPGAFELPKTNAVEPETAVEFDNVHFHYPTQPETKGLHGLSFKMKRGTTTAIVGPTGAGKTTVGRLLFRFYDVLGGSVKINGVDVRSVTQKSLRAAIGVVPQTASMFNDTIRANLLYGRRDATENDLVEAAKDAQLLDFIESLHEGWETVVGDRGLKLSGGEKQRAAIARCLLKDPPFVLLDEATSALDTLTENSVQEALDRLGKERTVLVIAHRLTTIRNADKIIVLKNGKVTEEGTHDELLSAGGTYADMWNIQRTTDSTSLTAK
ncbi:hypothetical protein ACA910_022420 [Epithemia clementina (nom. ined.)]